MSAHILFVCTGNVCRSPYLEALVRARLDAEFGPDHGITVASRGTQAMDGSTIDERIVPFLREALAAIPGYTHSEAPGVGRTATNVDDPTEIQHEARRLEAGDVESADLVITATREHRKAVNQLSARGLARTFTLRQLALLATGVDAPAFPDEPAARVGALASAAAAQRGVTPVGDAEQDIVDPHGREEAVYRAAVAQLLSGVDALIEALNRRPPRRPPPERTARDRPLVERDSRDASYRRARARRRRRRAIGRFVGRVVLVVLVVIVAGGCWVGVRGFRAYRHLQHLQTATTQLKTQLEAGNTAGATSLIAGVQANARAAHGLTSDTLWRFAEHAPIVGNDLRAAATVAEVSDQVGRGALPPLTALAGLLAPGSSTSGSGRLAGTIQVLAQQHGALIRAQQALVSSRAELAAVDTQGLVGPEGSTIRTLTSQLGTADSAIGGAIRASTILPAMFDTPTPQTYLLLFQNLAEARSLGGIAGSYAVVRVDHGSFTLLQTGAGSAIPQFANPVLNLGSSYTDFFEDRPSTYFVDTTETPYFPDAAQFARQMWKLRSGQTVNGVISTDPVMLSYLLAVTGPVQVPAVGTAPAKTLTSGNAVAYLLNGIYEQQSSPAEQDLVFARTTSAVFAALSGGRGSAVGLVRALQRGAAEGRLDVWDPSSVVTSGIAGTTLAGVPAAGTKDAPTVGLYVNDGTGSKMSWYLRRSASISVGGLSGGYRTVTVSLTLSSVAPKSGIPPYISGAGHYGVPVGTSLNVIEVLAPTGGAVVSATVDGVTGGVSSGQLHGRIIAATSVAVGAGSTHRVSFTLLARAGNTLPVLLPQPAPQSSLSTG